MIPIPVDGHGVEIEAVEWLPSGAGTGLVRVRGRWTAPEREAVELPVLVTRGPEGPVRHASLPDPRAGRDWSVWRGAYLVQAEAVDAGHPLSLEFAGGAEIELPPPRRGLAAGTPPRAPEPAPPAAAEAPARPQAEQPGGEVIDRAVLSERRARRAEAAEQAQARIAAEALKAVEVLELRGAELERRLEELTAERAGLAEGESVEVLLERLAAAEGRAVSLRQEAAEAREGREGLEAELAAGSRRVAELESALAFERAAGSRRAAELESALEVERAAAAERVQAALARADAREAHRDQALERALDSAAALRERVRVWTLRLRAAEVARTGEAVRLAVLEARHRTTAGALVSARAAAASRGREAAAARAETAAAHAELVAAQAEASQARAELGAAQERIAELERADELAAAESQVASLRAELAAAIEAREAEARHAERRLGEAQESMRSQTLALEAERADLAAALAEVAEQRAGAQARLADLEVERAARAALAAEIEAERLARGALEAELGAQGEAREAAEAALHAARSTAGDDLAEAVRVRDELHRAVEDLRGELVAAAESRAALHEAVAGLREELTTARAGREAAESEAQRLRAEQSAAVPELASLRARVAELESVAAELESVRAHAAELEAHREVSAGELDVLRARVAAAEAEHRAATQQLEAERGVATGQLEALRAQLRDAEAGRARSEHELTALRARVDAEAEARSQELDTLRARLAGMQAAAERLDALGERVAELEAELDALRAHLHGVEAERTAAAGENDALRARLGALRDEGGPGAEPVDGEDAAALRTRLAELERERDAALADVEALRALARAAEETRAAVEAELAALHGARGPSLTDRIAELERRSVAPEGLGARAQGLTPPAVGSARGGPPPPLVADLDAAAAALRGAAPGSEPGPEVAFPLTQPARGHATGTSRREYPWLRGALVKLAHDDPRTAARLIAALLPCQAEVLDDAVDYDLTIDELGTFSVAVGAGLAAVRPLRAPRARGQADFHLRSAALPLAEALAGHGPRPRRFAGPIRLAGRHRRRARTLAGLSAAAPSLAEAARAGARLEPGDVYLALPYAIHPSWARDHAFVVDQEVVGEGGGRWRIKVGNGAGIKVAAVGSDTGDPLVPDAVVTLTRAAFDALLRREAPPAGERPRVRGDRAAVALLKAWTDRAQGDPAPDPPGVP